MQEELLDHELSKSDMKDIFELVTLWIPHIGLAYDELLVVNHVFKQKDNGMSKHDNKSKQSTEEAKTE